MMEAAVLEQRATYLFPFYGNCSRTYVTTNYKQFPLVTDRPVFSSFYIYDRELRIGRSFLNFLRRTATHDS